jgi:hypothetical protein
MLLQHGKVHISQYQSNINIVLLVLLSLDFLHTHILIHVNIMLVHWLGLPSHHHRHHPHGDVCLDPSYFRCSHIYLFTTCTNESKTKLGTRCKQRPLSLCSGPSSLASPIPLSTVKSHNPVY